MLPVTPSTMVFPAKRAAGARGTRLEVFTRLRRLGVIYHDAQVLLDLVRIFTGHVRQGQPFKLALPLLARFLDGLASLLPDQERRLALEHLFQRNRRRLGVLGCDQRPGAL